MGCGDVRLLKTIGSVDSSRVTGQERAALNKLTMPGAVIMTPELTLVSRRCSAVRLDHG